MSGLKSQFLRFAAALGIAFTSTSSLAADGSVAPLNLFVLPAPTLRPISTNLPPDSAGLNPLAEKGDAEEKILMQTSTISPEAQQQLFEGLNGPIISQFEIPDEPAGALGWIQTNMLDPIFVPEVVKFGKVYVTGSIITAIQRRNPLALLNPLVLAIDW